MNEFKITVGAEDSGKRLDMFLLDFAKKEKLGISRTTLQKMISSGLIDLGGQKNIKPHIKVRQGQGIQVRLQEPKESGLFAEDIPLDVVYEDDHLALINKQAGIVVHPAPGNKEHTLVNALLARFQNLSDLNQGRPGIIHRLDKETSGILLIAKNNRAHLKLARQFSEHTVDKKYVALVKGSVDFDEDVIEIPVGRHPIKRKEMACRFADNAKYAKTCYRVLGRFRDFSYLELRPLTGRTHQLRVHLAFIGHPILGDAKYGKNNEFGRLALHAFSIGFIHPESDKFVEFSVPIPFEFEEVMKKSPRR